MVVAYAWGHVPNQHVFLCTHYAVLANHVVLGKVQDYNAECGKCGSDIFRA